MTPTALFEEDVTTTTAPAAQAPVVQARANQAFANQVRAEETRTAAAAPAYRLRPIMRQGTASSIPETWTRFATVADARQAVKAMYHDDRVLRVFIVTDEAPPRFVEWVER